MILTTTGNIEGREITEYIQIVYGEVIIGMHIGKDFLSSLTDVFGGRSKTYEKELQSARTMAEAELIEAAQQIGADAVVGVTVDHETMGQSNGMIMVVIKGTAVKLK